MTMKATCLMTAGVLAAVTALADAPATDPLDAVASQFSGNWNVDVQSFDTEFSRAGSQAYLEQRDCARVDAMLSCKITANGVLQSVLSFSWDAAAGVYRVKENVGGKPQPDLTLTIQGKLWTFMQETHDAYGAALHYRITRSYRTTTGASYTAGFSRNGTDWVMLIKGTEIKASAAVAH
jgi:hypothetical protein